MSEEEIAALSALRARVDAATGGDREIDAEVARLLLVGWRSSGYEVVTGERPAWPLDAHPDKHGVTVGDLRRARRALARTTGET